VEEEVEEVAAGVAGDGDELGETAAESPSSLLLAPLSEVDAGDAEADADEPDAFNAEEEVEEDDDDDGVEGGEGGGKGGNGNTDSGVRRGEMRTPS
jgi:hypothetical protein